MMSARRVTIAAMDFLALVVTGFCPATEARSATSGSMIFTFCVASPRPMLRTIFSRRGTAIRLVRPSSFCSAGRISFWYFSLSLAFTFAIVFSLLLLRRQRLAALFADPNLGVAFKLVTHTHRPAGAADQHHIRDLDGRFLLRNAALDVALRVGVHVLLD